MVNAQVNKNLRIKISKRLNSNSQFDWTLRTNVNANKRSTFGVQRPRLHIDAKFMSIS